MAAMSGGVDSSVAAMLALWAGYDCCGAMMKIHPCAGDNEADARGAADLLGIPLHVYDLSGEFDEKVVKRFVSAYSEGFTPNPCIDCNRYVKFGSLLDKTLELGADIMVTGHYARIGGGADGRYLLRKGADANKDQSYVLYALTQEQLAKTRFPLGDMTKSEVREAAIDAGLDNAMKRESQDICFVPEGDYARFICKYTGAEQRKGRFIDTEGADLGESKGVIHYTIGQRRGLGLSSPYPVYVLDIKPEDDVIVVGKEELLYSKTLHLNDINLIAVDRIDSPVRASVKIRYNHAEQPATIFQTGEDTLLVEFFEPQRAVTKGQAGVIYAGDIVVGGGTITYEHKSQDRGRRN